MPIDEPTVGRDAGVAPALDRQEAGRPPGAGAGKPAVALSPLIPSLPPAGAMRRSGERSRRPGRLGKLCAVLSVVVLLTLIYAYTAYDKATKPDLTTPTIVVQNYLQALLNDRDDSEASQYACTDQSGLLGLRAYRDQAVAFAANVGDDVSFSWGVGDVKQTGGDADVEVIITQVTSSALGSPGRSLHPWRMTTQRSSGWLVCKADAE